MKFRLTHTANTGHVKRGTAAANGGEDMAILRRNRVGAYLIALSSTMPRSLLGRILVRRGYSIANYRG